METHRVKSIALEINHMRKYSAKHVIKCYDFRGMVVTSSYANFYKIFCSGIARVYTFNPAFRQEGEGRLHLHEFWMVEAEEAFLHGDHAYETLLRRIEEFVKFVIREILDSSREELEFFANKNHAQGLIVSPLTVLYIT